ncbi:DinB family protein [Haliscomenobacter hydrossis]|uniref:DinB-like domain-containing protein n=1 Tax=Haliscomenobacter hydrossis (strain ATCC 27775 / DSM 1100 / LMG 10767 / O) TaxID=760192 RepID=F4L757_HALH1|nr:DinB family protein [Haliscomenobacter hydrossis]AEE52133.1 hypothetical protein Halhy_4289 [Haliscomenobacter hydrossis DSM 1100]
MFKSALPFMPEFFDRYINQTDDVPMLTILERTQEELQNYDWDKLQALGDYVYAPGKWTVCDIVQHLIDTERILTYRALCIARGEAANLPGFEEDDYALHAQGNQRSLVDLKAELFTLRTSTLQLFRSFNDVMLLQTGTANGKKLTPLALGFIVAGHQRHHFRVLEERYFN